jgi:hypothetical protein
MAEHNYYMPPLPKASDLVVDPWFLTSERDALGMGLVTGSKRQRTCFTPKL